MKPYARKKREEKGECEGRSADDRQRRGSQKKDGFTTGTSSAAMNKDLGTEGRKGVKKRARESIATMRVAPWTKEGGKKGRKGGRKNMKRLLAYFVNVVIKTHCLKVNLQRRKHVSPPF